MPEGNEAAGFREEQEENACTIVSACSNVLSIG
jgi:hypothetical protein